MHFAGRCGPVERDLRARFGVRRHARTSEARPEEARPEETRPEETRPEVAFHLSPLRSGSLRSNPRTLRCAL